jgi:zinc-RING finger domain
MSSTNEDITAGTSLQQQPQSEQEQHCHDPIELEESNTPASTGTTVGTTSTVVVADSRFSCNICLDSVVEPVVTQCGHLYCWPCLYQWLEPGLFPEERVSLGLSMYNVDWGIQNNSRRVCPVCKSPCSVPTLVPIYVRSTKESSVSSSPVDEQINNNHDREVSIPEGQQENTSHSSLQNENLDDTMENVEERAVVSREGREASSQPGLLEQQPQDNTTTTSLHYDGENLGLRQRRAPTTISPLPPPPPTTTTTSSSSSTTTTTIRTQQRVPSRPAANSPQHPPTNRQQQGISTSHHHGGNWMSPNGRTGRHHHPHGSLTQGILLSFQQAAIQAQSSNNEGSTTIEEQGQQQQQHRSIPSLHSIRDGNLEGYNHLQQQQSIDVNSETTQYLSRLLIMLTSFVILCLLLL